MTTPTAAPRVRRGSNLPRVGDYNQVVVMEAIRSHPEGLSRVELARLTGLSAQTVSNICRRLIDTDLVVEAGKLGSGRGKPRTLLRLEARGRYAVGVHLDPAVATVVVLDLLGAVVARSDHPVRPGAGPAEVLEDVARDVEALVVGSGVDRDRVVGLGVAVPGPVDSAGGAVVTPPNLPGWDRVPVCELLAQATGLPVHLDKDVVAAAVAEVWSGGVTGTGSAVFVYLGVGVGAGLVLGGEVLRGASGNAGEVGALLTGPEGTSASSGVQTSWGGACSPVELVSDAVKAGLGDWVPPRGAGSAGHARQAQLMEAFTQVCALARDGDPRAVALLEDRARRTAKVVGDLVVLLDVEQVVFGGPLWRHLEPVFLRVVPPLVRERSVANTLHEVDVRSTRVGADVAAVGAGCLVLEDSFSPRSATLLLRR